MSWLWRSPLFDRDDGFVLLLLAWLVPFLFSQDFRLATSQKHLNGFGEIFYHMKAVCALSRLGSTLGRCFCILTAPITTHYSDVWVMSHPPCRGVCLTIRQKVNDPVALQVHEDRAEPAATPERKIVDAKTRAPIPSGRLAEP
jgi:hypothetical protein